MRFGVLGTGHWATVTQAAALATHPSATLAGVWGRSPDKAADLGSRYGVPAYADVEELFAAVDAVAIALPPDVQAPLAVRAARAGKHLLLDKPLALDPAAADEVVAAAATAGVATVVFFTNRFVPSVDTFLTANAELGGWYAAHGTMYASIFQPGNPYAGSLWRKEHGGLWDLGPHALSVVLPLLGPVLDLSAAEGPRDTAHLLLRHENGAASTLSLTVDAAPDATSFGFSYFGEHGATTLPPWDVNQVEAFGNAVTALMDAAATGRRHPCDAALGARVTHILAAAEQARRTSTIVAV
ncbi:Gfo/Idh/MocA family protein [Dactylosporangium matsuzakiense]|uniref:Oxidoreductase n=1 Tax=Dactylosporangium matsuzakiense TaxID=53360 RepID=A0A9W6KRI7_9ACTN|nr:Gfo/Idh/MocA family oxidoreductase [Dactylosporangium matsuzakiense]UWZ46900.1 Gfo/Idh/MocA family oxidoreductase [Dactylosporangium matsuzakiense]GLL04209.1 oxidoreductase [Dactylosporangium matsuzakiense]